MTFVTSGCRNTICSVLRGLCEGTERPFSNKGHWTVNWK